ncbi:MAG TPA: YfhO family protein [Thermoanaerobaculia bacterium]|nr:YfhO family protein [Thermoanaerobaculia bacterium]
MTALRLLAVYFGTTAGCLLLVRRFVAPVRAAACAFLLLAPFLLIGRALWTAGVYAPLDITYDSWPLAALRGERGVGPTRNAVLGDVVYQGIPWRKAIREEVKNGRFPLWNRFSLAGEPLLAMQQPAAFSPGTAIGFLLPLGASWTFDMALRCFLALLSAYLFLREVGCAESPSLLGAAAWAFSDYLVFYAGHPLAPAAAPFPLLLLGLRRVAREGTRRAAGLLLVALLLIATAGHPESLLHTVAAGGVFFLFELFWDGRERIRRAVALALAAGALALGLSAVFLLPFAEAAPKAVEYTMRRNLYAKSHRSRPVEAALDRSSKHLVPYAFGIPGQSQVDQTALEPAAYAGSVLLPLALVGLISRRREKWPLLLLGVIGLSAWAGFPVIADGLARLPFFDVSINERLVFLPAFSTAALAAFGAQELRERSRGMAARLTAAAAIVFVVLGVLSLGLAPRLRDLGMAASDRRDNLLAQLVPVALVAAIAWIARRRHRGTLGVALLIPVLLLQRKIEVEPFHPTFPARAFYPRLPLLDAIPRGVPARSAALGYTLVPNAAVLYGLEDVRGYEALTLTELTQTFPLWCVPQPVWFNRVEDPTKPFLSFLNVRYVIAPPGYAPPPRWKVLSEDRTGRLLENPDVLPRVFVPRRIVREREPARQRERLYAITDFAETGVLEGPSAPPETNGPARVEITRYEGPRMDLSIEAREKTVIATSVTNWPGWRLTVDGNAMPLLRYNLAFVAFEAPPGRHRAVLDYWPESFAAGLWISGVSLLLSIACLAWPRSSGAAAESASSAAMGANVRLADHSIHSLGSGTGDR